MQAINHKLKNELFMGFLKDLTFIHFLSIKSSLKALNISQLTWNDAPKTLSFPSDCANERF